MSAPHRGARTGASKAVALHVTCGRRPACSAQHGADGVITSQRRRRVQAGVFGAGRARAPRLHETPEVPRVLGVLEGVAAHNHDIQQYAAAPHVRALAVVLLPDHHLPAQAGARARSRAGTPPRARSPPTRPSTQAHTTVSSRSCAGRARPAVFLYITSTHARQCTSDTSDWQHVRLLTC